MALANPGRGGDAIDLGHSQVHQEDLGMEPVRQVDGLSAGARLPDDIKVRLRSEHGAQARSHNDMVGGDDRADLRGGRGTVPPAASARGGPVGSSTTSVQPWPGALSTLSEPFTVSTRSRMATSPSPPCRPGSIGRAKGLK